MLTEVWVHKTVIGKEMEAIELAKRTAEYHENRGPRCRVMRPLTGKLNRLFIVLDFENQAAKNEYWAKTFRDATHKAIVREWWEKGYFDIDAMERFYYHDVQ